VLVLPTVAATATPIGSDNVALGGPDTSTLSSLDSVITRFTYPFNLSGFPSLVLPCGFDLEGLPIGMQIAGAPWQEALLVRVGHAFQQATDWHRRRPPLN
jgi:aspartyl-tRNA(Asn)/glutamyl-tRNA(Gln) amidotransferase subunit A